MAEKNDLDRLCRNPMPEEERRRICYVRGFVPVEPEDFAPQRTLSAAQVLDICREAGFEYDDDVGILDDERKLKHLYASREGQRLEAENGCKSDACTECYHAVIDHVWSE